MEQMTAGMISYFLSNSKLQASTSAMPAPAPSELGPVGSAILGERGRLKFGTRVELLVALSQVHLSRFGDCKRGENVDSVAESLSQGKRNLIAQMEFYPDQRLKLQYSRGECEV